MKQEIIYTNHINEAIDEIFQSKPYDHCFALCDSNTHRQVLPRIASHHIDQERVIVIPAGEEHKNIDTLTAVWNELSQKGATRHSLLINIGGGMVTDLGGMAAATFKRGIDFCNIPTTLLGAVDAAIGGKTGINLGGLKNEIGTFAHARQVIISTLFFDTLPHKELLSGYAEMLKHGLIDSERHYYELIDTDITAIEPDNLLPLLQHSIGVKQAITHQDPLEKGIRRVLNLGHTIGHAIEEHSHLHGHPVPHGYAIAWGLVCELIIAHRAISFPSTILYDLAHYVEKHYGSYPITCDDYDELITFMLHDKKNKGNNINFSLLKKIGEYSIDNYISRDEIEIALDFYRDLFHL